MPIITFSILIGLNMDYDVFLVTGILSARSSGLSNRAAIVAGLENNGTVIGVAGLIVLLVPLLPILFAANPDQATVAQITIAQRWHGKHMALSAPVAQARVRIEASRAGSAPCCTEGEKLQAPAPRLPTRLRPPCRRERPRLYPACGAAWGSLDAKAAQNLGRRGS